MLACNYLVMDKKQILLKKQNKVNVNCYHKSKQRISIASLLLFKDSSLTVRATGEISSHKPLTPIVSKITSTLENQELINNNKKKVNRLKYKQAIQKIT